AESHLHEKYIFTSGQPVRVQRIRLCPYSFRISDPSKRGLACCCCHLILSHVQCISRISKGLLLLTFTQTTQERIALFIAKS
uniref:Ovule protein n=1 Tax=Parascaris univalens TaxID=6257 RepID=A0A915A849_PARUN